MQTNGEHYLEDIESTEEEYGVPASDDVYGNQDFGLYLLGTSIYGVPGRDKIDPIYGIKLDDAYGMKGLEGFAVYQGGNFDGLEMILLLNNMDPKKLRELPGEIDDPSDLLNILKEMNPKVHSYNLESRVDSESSPIGRSPNYLSTGEAVEIYAREMRFKEIDPVRDSPVDAVQASIRKEIEKFDNGYDSVELKEDKPLLDQDREQEERKKYNLMDDYVF